MVTGSSDASVAAARARLPEEVLVVRADTASIEDTARVVQQAGAAFGALTGLFLNAGIFAASPIDAVDEATWDRLFEVNAKGQFFTLQKALPLLGEGASVVVTVGIGATRGTAGAGVAAGSRGALLTMIPPFAVELAPRRIRINAVSPRAIDTPIIAKTGLPPEQVTAVKQGMAAQVLFQRLGQAREVATTVAFLLSDDASYITGKTSSSAVDRGCAPDRHLFRLDAHVAPECNTERGGEMPGSGKGDYNGERAVITGGGSGIGFAVARLLVDGGARVVITGHSQATLDGARERLGEHAVTVRGDVASLSDLDALADQTRNELGGIEALFVNAGIAPLTPLGSTTEEAFDEVHAVNVKGAYFTVQKPAPLLSEGAGVVLTTSVANTIGMVDTSVYAASKAALR